MNNTPLTPEQLKEITLLVLENLRLSSQLARAHHTLIEKLGESETLSGSVSVKLLSEIEQLEASAFRLESLVEPLKQKLGLN